MLSLTERKKTTFFCGFFCGQILIAYFLFRTYPVSSVFEIQRKGGRPAKRKRVPSKPDCVLTSRNTAVPDSDSDGDSRIQVKTTASSKKLCWCRHSLLVERRTRDRKVASSNPGRNGGECCSPELTFCADS